MSQLLDKLNKEQLEAVTHTGGPLLIVAGAGTGKTTVVTRRLAYLIEQTKAKPEEILALTFTEKAATEMQERVEQLLPLGIFDLWISTFHGFCQRILERHALDIGLPNNFVLLDDVKQWVLIYNNLDKFELDYYRPAGNPSKFIESLVRHFSKCKDELVTPEKYLEYADNLKFDSDSAEAVSHADEKTRAKEIANAYHVYQKLLVDNNFLDFGDLINYTIRLFKERPAILSHYIQHFKFIMVDEFQDTNFAQYQLVKMLTNQNNSNLVVVGDDDQSIYKFRGASVSNILKFKQDFPNLKEISLKENYRSSQEILDLAYNFIQANNPNRLEVKLGINKKLHSNLKAKAEIKVLEGKDLSNELNLVVNKIVELKEKNTNSSWNDFAILIRANNSAKELLPRLEAAGITYSFMASQGLYNKPIIFNLISYLRLLGNFHDSQALYRVMQLPKFKISPNDLATITYNEKKKTWSLYETLKNIDTVSGLSEQTNSIIKSLLSMLLKHANLAAEKTIAELFLNVVEDLDIPKLISGSDLQSYQDRELLEQFFKRIELFEDEESDRTLRKFLENLDLELMAGSEGPIKFDPELGPESLKILTIHSAKGLEFEYVFVVNMVDQKFPSRNMGESIKLPESLIQDILPEGDFHLQEERRLFYVALTRAKTHLYLTWSKDYGGSRYKKPSLFLQETHLVPSEKIIKSTGKVIFSKPKAKGKQKFTRLPKEFSFTEINVFKNCPLEYKYRYYLKIPAKGTANLSFGKTIHNSIFEFSKIYKNLTESRQVDLFGNNSEIVIPLYDDLLEIYKKEWIKEWYPTKKDEERFLKLGKEMLKYFYDELVNQRPKIKYLEEGFRMPLGNFHFVGRIDRADETKDGLLILDYKTGKAQTKHSKKDLDQLKIYQWAATDFWKENVKGLTYWYLNGNQKIPVDLCTNEELVELQSQLLEDANQILDAIKYDMFEELHQPLQNKHECSFGIKLV